MLGNYQNFEKLEEIYHDQQLNDKPKIHAITVFVSLLAQLMYLLGWVALILNTDFGYYLLYDPLIFAITFTLTALATLIFQALLLYQKSDDVYKKFLGITFLLINGFFVSYLMLSLSNQTLFYVPYTQIWILLIYIALLQLAFIIIPSQYSKYRWICVLIIPAFINFITEFFYYELGQQFQAWLFIFCVVCLYMTQLDYGMREFYLSINILGFATLFLINTAKYVIDAFQNKTSTFVYQLQEQKQVQFIFFTYMIAAISSLLTPLLLYIFSLYNFQFFRGDTIHASFWIFLGFNYLLFFCLFFTHRYFELQVKQFLALAYLIIHQLSITGILFVFIRQNNYNFFTFYQYISFQQIQFIYGAITLQINQKFCLKSLYHILLMVPAIANFTLFLYWIEPSRIVLIIILNSFLIIYLGQQCLQESNFYLQFKEDEYLISGALFSDPIALFLTQSIFVHFKTKS
ncbi:hypothetical protein pb186bvf_007220 [Paramecium bursaria]